VLVYFPFEKKVSVSRHITVGFIKSNLKDEILPNKLYITIQEIEKSTKFAENEINIFSFIVGYNNYELRFKLFSVKDELQFSIEKLAENIRENYLTFSKDKVEFLKEKFDEEQKRWLVPIKLEVVDEYENRAICLLVLILDTDSYQEFKRNNPKILRLLLRYQAWITTIEDCTHESLSILSLELKHIIEEGDEPTYYGVSELLNFSEIERSLTQMLLAAHRAHKGGLSFNQILSELKIGEKVLRKTIEGLVNKGIMWEPEKDIYDIMWHI